MIDLVRALLCIAACSALELTTNEAVVLSPDGSYGYRVTALSESLLRIERSNNNASDFEDRPSYLAVNRSWGGVQGGITKDNLTASTKFYSVKFAFKKSAQSLTKNSSAFVKNNADAVCSTKCLNFRTQPPLHAASAQDCSKHCDGDTKCNYWVYGGKAPNCFLLSAVVGDRHQNDRTFGGIAPVPSVTPTPAPPKPTKQDSVTIFDASDQQIWQGSLETVSFTPQLPAPSDVPSAWGVRDYPRFIPPAWGATPKPADTPPLGPLEATNGYDTRGMDVPDAYFFLPKTATVYTISDSASIPNTRRTSTSVTGYHTLVQDFLHLTGPIPQLPDYAFGLWFTWCKCCSLLSFSFRVSPFFLLRLILAPALSFYC
jgi:hypothetical protein